MKIDLYGHPFMCIELCACIVRRSAWRAMKKCTSRLEGNYKDSVVLSSFGQTNQLTVPCRISSCSWHSGFVSGLLNFLQKSTDPQLLLFRRRGHQQHVLGRCGIVIDFARCYAFTDLLRVVATCDDVLAMKLCATSPAFDCRRRSERSPELFGATVTRCGHVERDLKFYQFCKKIKLQDVKYNPAVVAWR